MRDSEPLEGNLDKTVKNHANWHWLLTNKCALSLSLMLLGVYGTWMKGRQLAQGLALLPSSAGLQCGSMDLELGRSAVAKYICGGWLQPEPHVIRNRSRFLPVLSSICLLDWSIWVCFQPCRVYLCAAISMRFWSDQNI